MKPKYQKVFENLNHEIVAGRFRPGQKFPSEAALVKRFDVSRITVGHALRELEQRGMIDRVAGSGTYVRGSARQSREGLLFGLIIPNLGETEIFEPICQAIAAAPESKGHALLWAHAGAAAENREEEALQLCRQCISRGVGGAFFAPLEISPGSAEANHRVMKLLKEARIPVVLLDRRPDDDAGRERSDLVGIDNHRAGYLATEHLLRLGAKRIGFISYKGQAPTVQARMRGYKDALARWAEPRASHTVQFNAGVRLHLPADALACDSFVCSNDRIAGHLMHTLLGLGRRIPRDARIVGMDDVNYAALLPVPLTTIRQPCRDIGETALRMMLERLDRPKMPARDVLLDCTLIVRESCGGELAGSGS